MLHNPSIQARFSADQKNVLAMPFCAHKMTLLNRFLSKIRVLDRANAGRAQKAKPPCAKSGAPFCAHKSAILEAEATETNQPGRKRIFAQTDTLNVAVHPESDR
jgi:hypothetical protein